MRRRNACLLVVVLLSSCSPTQFDIRRARAEEYQTFVKIVNRYYAPLDGAKFKLDTAGHPPLPQLVKQLDEYSTLIVLRGEFRDIMELGIRFYTRGDTVIISTVTDDGPCDRAGIKVSDRIIRIDSQATTGLAQEKIIELLEGVARSKVHISVRRGSAEDLTIVVKRGARTPPPLPCLYMDSTSTGYVRIRRIMTGVSDLLKACLVQLKGYGMKSLLLDLRRSPGGYLEEAVNSAELLLPGDSTIGERRGSGDLGNETYRVHRTGWTTFPCVVLVDSSTGGGAELMAGALQANKRAVVVGTKTAGKGVVQRWYDLSDTLAVQLTIGYLFLPSGKSFHRTGITPDYTLTAPASGRKAVFPKTVPELEEACADSSDVALKTGLDVLKGLR